MRLPRPVRSVMLAWHITAAAGWLALLAAAVAFPWYDFDGLLLVDVSIALSTGLLLATLSPMGLARQWWIVGKLAGSALLLAAGALALRNWYLPWSRPAGLAVLWVLVWLSVARPWGKTPYGKVVTRRQHGRHEKWGPG
jgi:hypothetical protein